MAGNAVQVRGLTKRYGDTKVLNGVDLCVRHGEVMALLGPNGAGKTTTVEILGGFRAADSGEVSVLGVDPARGDRRWRSRLGVVTQQANDGANLTVREYVDYFSRAFLDPVPAADVIAQVGLTPQGGTRIGRLSGGQRRRLDVAMALVGRPELLFLDEPTTGFDPEARLQFWQLVGDLAHSGVTMLLTSHNLEEVEALADRISILVEGRVVATGTTAEIGSRDQEMATVTWSESGRRHSHETGEPNAFVAELLAERGALVSDMEIARRSLESIYLDMISASGEGGRANDD